MSEKPHRRLLPFINTRDERRAPRTEPDAEPALTRLLRQWDAPNPSSMLDARVRASADQLLTPRRRRHRALMLGWAASALICLLVLTDARIAAAAVSAIRSSVATVIEQVARTLNDVALQLSPSSSQEENASGDVRPVVRSTDIHLPAPPAPAPARRSTRGTALLDVSTRLALEVRALTLLSRSNVLPGMQVTVTPNARGVRVEAVADTKEQKDKLLAALEPVTGLPGLVLDVRQIDEQKTRDRVSPNVSTSTRDVEVVQDMPPLLRVAETWIQGRLTDQLGREPTRAEVAAEVSEFANRAVNQSRVVLVQSLSVSQITNRFSSSDLQNMQPPTYEEWRALVRGSADALRRETHALTLLLQPLLWEEEIRQREIDADASVHLPSPEEAGRVAKEIGELGTAADESMRQAFAFSVTGHGMTLDRLRWAQSLRRLEELAAALVSWR